MAEKWLPINEDELNEILEEEYSFCSDLNKTIFQNVKTNIYQATIERYGKNESVFVVAKKGDEVIYYEDVEEGFNISKIDSEGNILNHYCNQDTLDIALSKLSKEITGTTLLPASKIS